jgi:hypothetical protein
MTRSRRALRITLWAVAALLALAAAAAIGLRVSGRVALPQALAETERRLPLEDTAVVSGGPRLEDDENAAAWLRAGAASLVWSKDEHRLVGDLSFLPAAEWTPDQNAAIAALLERYRSAITTMAHALELPGSDWGVRVVGGRWQTPDLMPLIDAARFLAADARLAFRQGRVDDGVQTLALMARLTDSLAAEPSLLTALIANAAENLTGQVALEALGPSAPWRDDPTRLEGVARVLPTADPLAYGKRAIAMELALSEQQMGEKGHEPTTGRWAALSDWMLRDLSRAELLRARLEIADLFATPYGTAPERFESGAAPFPWQVYRIIAWVATSDTRRQVARFQFAAAERQLVDAALAFRQLDLAGGGFPAQRPAVPDLERPDPFTGSLLGYRVLPDGAVELAVDNAEELLRAIRVPTRSAQSLARPIVLEP